MNSEASGYAASLRQMVNGNYVDFDELRAAANRIEALEAALKPFAMKTDAPSLSKALGHISREHLWAARAALAPEHQDK